MMQVVGTSSHIDVLAASKDRKFHINEVLVIDDPSQDHKPRGTVVETTSANDMMPDGRNGIMDESVRRTMALLGYDLSKEAVHMARIRVLDDLETPITIGSEIHTPSFEEVEDVLLRVKPEEGFVLGSIRGTREALNTLPIEYASLSPLYNPVTKTVQPQDGVPFVFSHKEMTEYPHVGIFGSAGSGKSFLLRVFCEEMMHKSLPGILFDPHQEMSFDREFPGLPSGFGESFVDHYKILTVCEDVGIDFKDLSSIDLVDMLRGGAGDQGLSESMEEAVMDLHTPGEAWSAFKEKLETMRDQKIIMAKWDTTQKSKEDAPKDKGDEGEDEDKNNSGAKKAPPASSKAKEEEEKLFVQVCTIKEHQNIKPDTARSLVWRFNRLRPDDMFSKGIEPVEDLIKGRKLAVIRAQEMWHLELFAAYACRRLYRKRRDHKEMRAKAESFPTFFIAADEAHGFLHKSFERPAKSIIRRIAQEGRKHNVWLVLATQRPALMDETVNSQLNTKFIFRTNRKPDLDVIRGETDLSAEETNRLPYLPSGVCFVTSALIGHTTPVKVRVAKTQAPFATNPFDELEETTKGNIMQFLAAIKPHLPLASNAINQKLKVIQAALGVKMSDSQIVDMLEDLAAKGYLKAESKGMFKVYSAV